MGATSAELSYGTAMVSSLEGSRLEILAIIQKQGSASVDQIAQEIGLAPGTVRRHLDILQRDRLVSFDQVRKKAGRPGLVYFLTEEGHESGYREYPKLLTLLLGELATLTPTESVGKGGEELLRFLIARISAQVSSPYLEPDQSSQELRIAKLNQALADGGFSPEISQGDRQVQIRLCNCPFRAVALCQKLVCHFDHELIANILGVEPVCQYTIHDGNNTCLYVAPMGG
jgi:predicted ArsR family transcriptional regulator